MSSNVGEREFSHLDQERMEDFRAGSPASCAYTPGLQIRCGVYPEAEEEEVIRGAAAAFGHRGSPNGAAHERGGDVGASVAASCAICVQ